MLEKGLGPLDIPNDEVPVEPKPDAELILVLLLPPTEEANKPSNPLSAAYLSAVDAELPEAETRGPNPELDAACCCEEATIKKIKEIR